MTKQDKEYIQIAARLAAHDVAKELNCTDHEKRLATVETLSKINCKGVKSNRKFIFFGIGILFLTAVGTGIANYIWR